MKSSPTESRQRRGAATRADIVGVARRLFSEHGYHTTSLADIQEATGLTKGAFYHHFRSKEDLALAVVELARVDYETHLLGPAGEAESPGERIRALLDLTVELNARPEWCNCQMLAVLAAELTAADGRLRDAVRDLQVEMHNHWRDLLAEAAEAGQLSGRLDPAAAAQWIVSTMAGLMLARKLGSAQAPTEGVVDLMKRALLRPHTEPSIAERKRSQR